MIVAFIATIVHIASLVHCIAMIVVYIYVYIASVVPSAWFISFTWSSLCIQLAITHMAVSADTCQSARVLAVCAEVTLAT